MQRAVSLNEAVLQLLLTVFWFLVEAEVRPLQLMVERRLAVQARGSDRKYLLPPSAAGYIYTHLHLLLFLLSSG